MKKIFIIMLSLVVALAFIPALTYSQAPQKVLFQNWTSSTCGPCASNNPGLRQWVQDHWTNLACVAFHVNWPQTGDPMNLYNPTQVQDWVGYYGVNAVPEGIMMGSQPYYIGSPFNWSDMTNRYNTLSASTSPCGVTVTDTRIPPDSNKAVVTITNYTNLPSGTYFLRVMEVEHWVIYSTPPGSNGETIFENVFRRAIPSSLGTYINTNAGTYTYEFRYKIDSPPCNDTSIYTIAYVQNDANRSILNTARNGMYFTGITPNTNEIPNKIELSQNYPNPFNPTTNIKFDLPKDEFVTLKVYDLLGKEVRTIVEGMHKAGKYNVVVDIGDLSSGIYFYTLKTDNFIDTKKMTLLK